MTADEWRIVGVYGILLLLLILVLILGIPIIEWFRRRK